MGSKSRSSSSQSNQQADNRVSGEGIVVGGTAEALIASSDEGLAIGSADSITITDFSEETISKLLATAADIAEGSFEAVEAFGDDSLQAVGEALGVVQESVEAVENTAAEGFSAITGATDDALDTVSGTVTEAFEFSQSITDKALEELNENTDDALKFVGDATRDALGLVEANTAVALEAARNADARISEFAIAATVAAVIGVTLFISNPGFLA